MTNQSTNFETAANREPSSSDTAFAPRPLIGGLLFLATAPAHLFLDREASITLAAITLALIGGAYIGFGAADGRAKTFWTEFGVALLFGGAAAAGLLWHWAALPIGLALHAGWDLLHHNPGMLARIPRWYIPLCLVFDLLAAAFLTALYAF